MKKLNTLIGATLGMVGVFALTQCSEAPKENQAMATESSTTTQMNFGGFDSQEKWGEHLVMIGGCGDCHTPKKMTAQGPEQDSSLALSGNPAGMPAPDVNRKEFESKGYIATQTLQAWVGPWGISYAANITSDPTGIGGWTEDQFFNAIRHGKSKGLDNARPLMPPMPWQVFARLSDSELKAIFAYLKSTKPIKNVVPEYKPPVTAMK